MSRFPVRVNVKLPAKFAGECKEFMAYNRAVAGTWSDLVRTSLSVLVQGATIFTIRPKTKEGTRETFEKTQAPEQAPEPGTHQVGAHGDKPATRKRPANHQAPAQRRVAGQLDRGTTRQRGREKASTRKVKEVKHGK
jgi:hypothetical protein